MQVSHAGQRVCEACARLLKRWRMNIGNDLVEPLVVGRLHDEVRRRPLDVVGDEADYVAMVELREDLMLVFTDRLSLHLDGDLLLGR